MGEFFRKIENEKQFEDFIEKSMETNMKCAGCGLFTRHRAILVDKKYPSRLLVYGLCSSCQEKCLKSESFAEIVSEKISRSLEIENN